MKEVSETLFFIGKCLSLSVHPGRADEIRKVIQRENINWERVVWLGSSHYVIPALFVQFRNNGLLNELPDDLVDYLAEIYQLNLARNLSIQKEAIHITSALNSIGIAPLFLKGTAHVLDGLYSDPGERMIGDIDFLLPEKDILPAVEKLIEHGYFKFHDFDVDLMVNHRHYPRLKNHKTVAAIEIHRQPVSLKYSRKFNFEVINRDKKKLCGEGEAYVLSDRNQILHNILNAQMNDNAFVLRRIQLRNKYDLLLLSERESPLEAVIEFGYYQKQLNAYLFVASNVMGEPGQINYVNNKSVKRYYRRLLYFMNKPWMYKGNIVIHFFKARLIRYITLPIRAIYNKAEREALIWRLTNKSWYVAHLKSWGNMG
ncbi:nucleotidyltransferase family protein [Maribellus sp. YY47]|uniref:nucleotidyltransferase family protein n=1 Tax=Maribellus sp. YY47 TaxID=2929486 RepID=UPI00200092F1|nr:nucleotidyltransferase family protein [Maribellus sp. YY47]MCK3685498.1 nucleotidyltransferase family protein [Maribellus sp. YY47]